MPARDFRPLCIALLFGVSVSAHGQTNLPEGAGREIAQSKCAGCHELGRVLRSGYSAQDWRTVVHMMNNVGAQVPDEQLPILVKYLAENFPERPRPQGQTIAGPAQVALKEWVLPTPGSRPHDPLATLDGSIWYTGQMANVLGRIDPTSGHIAEHQLSTPMSGPHGLVADRDGAIWFTANFTGYIGKLDVATGKITEYKLPSPDARDPHTPLFDRDGVLWFTVLSANMIGRLDPRTGQIKLVTSPTPHSNPYGLVITSKGVPFFCEFGANKPASIDPATMKIREYDLPHAESRPRRIAITPDDIIWYTDYARGHLGRFNPATGEVKEYASPGGPQSQPMALPLRKGLFGTASLAFGQIRLCDSIP